MKEPEIKLFGRKIVLPESGGFVAGVESAVECNSGSGGGDSGEVGKSDDEDQTYETKQQQEEHQNHPNETQEFDENPKTPSIDEDVVSEDHLTAENEQSDPTDGQQKTLKKPDKILPCPRCNSMETKFCYYNNYNLSQPRHFCKSCQRYWTAGGTMRNVPVGAGRRKNKNSAPHCHHITISENALQSSSSSSRIIDNGFHHHPSFKPNATVLSFGPDRPVFEPPVSGSNISENGAVKNGLDIFVGSSDNGSQTPAIHNMNGFPYPVPCIPGVQWPFPWNSPVQLPPLYPIPFYPPPPYWGCNGPQGWNVGPWLSGGQTGAGAPAPDSPLGKHSRNGELIKPMGSENSSIVVPKTLRVDDPEEAKKSSIWETLGIKYDSISREGLFKALQPKVDEKKLVGSTSPALMANPAALSRSITFQEGA